MKRSRINQACRDAIAFFQASGWVLPPNPKWDVTDLGLGHFEKVGLVLVNLAEEQEYCEKLIYARRHQLTPPHMHRKKKEDIICRRGRLAVELWAGHPATVAPGVPLQITRNGELSEALSGAPLILHGGERVTIPPGIYHAFWAESEECLIGEVSSANDDACDNFFVDPHIGRFPKIEEDEPSLLPLYWESATVSSP